MIASIFFCPAERLLAASMEGGPQKQPVVSPAQRQSAQPHSAQFGDVQDLGSGSH